MKLTSPEFKQGKPMPGEYSCDGMDISPELTISDIPKDAKSLVLIMDDPDAPAGTWVHWVVFDIDPSTAKIKKGSIPGTQGKNSWGKDEYRGPCPPSGTHRYFFRLYALDTALNLESSADKKSVENAMKGHVIEKTELMGIYSR